MRPKLLAPEAGKQLHLPFQFMPSSQFHGVTKVSLLGGFAVCGRGFSFL
jgi:hypothetical protein